MKKITELENTISELKSKYEKEKEDMVKANTFEINRFGDFISRLEKRKQELKTENEKLKKENEQLKIENDRLKPSLKRRESSSNCKEPEKKPKSVVKLKSVVTQPQPKRATQPQPKRRLDIGHYHRY